MSAPLPGPVVAGNWKMHKGPSDTAAFFRDFLAAWPPREDRTVVFFPPAVSLAAAVDALADRPDIRLGVQNVHWEAGGAFTGEISAEMAVDAGADFVLVGHSERRHVFGETPAETAKKVRAGLGELLFTILCVGEKIGERRAGRARDVVLEQLDAGMEGAGEDEPGDLLVAYEPVWAIGTGETASPADAAEMHLAIRERLRERYPREVADAIPILYGGSVKPDNAAELMAQENVDGVLVGGASLDPAGFAAICAAAG